MCLSCPDVVHFCWIRTPTFALSYILCIPQIGDEVKVRILEVDQYNKKLRLTMRNTDVVDSPGGYGGGRGGAKRAKSVEQFLNLSPDEWIGGTVASITNFGAFVAVDADTDGLLHISQIAEDHVSNVEDHLQVGQDVQVRVIEVDVDNCRLGLSMREPRASAPRGGSRGKKDVSVLLGRDPDEFVTGRVRARIIEPKPDFVLLAL